LAVIKTIRVKILFPYLLFKPSNCAAIGNTLKVKVVFIGKTFGVFMEEIASNPQFSQVFEQSNAISFCPFHRFSPLFKFILLTLFQFLPERLGQENQ
jgi:hypothetical protein